jgi:serine/threonine protein kinase
VTASGDLKVTDFGIARAASAVTNTASGAIFGTAGYISPEQALGEPVGPASDLYSLGVVLYEMLTGDLPFAADNSIAVCLKHVNEPPVPPQLLNPEISEGMSSLVLMLLAKHPGDRYGSAMQLLSDLERVRDGLLPALALQTVTQPLRRVPHATPLSGVGVSRGPRRARTLAFATVATVALFGALLFGLSQEGSGEGTLPRAQGFAREILDPPVRAAVNTTKTGANTGDDAAPNIQSPSSPAPSPTSSPAPSPAAPSEASSEDPPAASSEAPSAAPSEEPPAVFVGPPEDQAPSESQYDGGE